MLDSDFLEAEKLFAEDDLARRAFRVVVEQPGISGWAVAKKLDLRPEAVDAVLRKLNQVHVVKSPESGLSGNYVLTGAGFDLRRKVLRR